VSQPGIRAASLVTISCLGVFAGGVQHAAHAQAVNGSPLPANVRKHAMKVAGIDYVDYKILLHVTLNDTLDGLMILDTGGDTLLFPNVARDLKLSLETIPDTKLALTRLAHVTFGAVEIKNIQTFVAPLFIQSWDKDHPGSKLLGLLGIETLKDWAVGIDIPSRTSAWWEGGKITQDDVRSFNSVYHDPNGAKYSVKASPRRESISAAGQLLSNDGLELAEAQSVRLYKKHFDDHFDAHSYFQAKLDDYTGEFALDTGAHDVSVTAQVGARLHPLLTRHGESLSAYGTFRVDQVFVRALKIGDIAFDFPTVAIQPPSDRPDEGGILDVSFVGITPFEKCRIVMDFPGQMLYVSPHKGYNKSPYHGIMSMGLYPKKSSSESPCPMTVFAGFPAELAGMKDGDSVVSINGTSFAEFNASDEGFLHKPIVLVVNRKGASMPITITIPALK